MLDQVNDAIETYHKKWHALIEARTDKAFFTALKPTAVAWKTADRAEYDKLFRELHDYCDVIIDVSMNERWIAKMHLKDTQLMGGIQIIKLMQRRPNSTDAVGLDHIDWYSKDVTRADDVLAKEPDLKYTHETNGATWISLWFDGTEAKLRTDTVVDSCIRDLNNINAKILP